MKKVLIIISNFNGVGGAETATHRFLRKIDKGKFQVDVCFFGHEDEFAMSVKEAVNNAICFDVKKDGKFSTYMKLLKLVSRDKDELVQTHLALAVVYGLFLRPLLPFKWISTEHNLSDRRKTSSAGRVYYYLARRKIHYFIGVSSKVIDWLKTAGVPENKLRLIPNPIESVEYPQNRIKRSDFLQACGWPEGVKIVGTAANLRSVKGLNYLLDSIKLLIDAGKPVRLVIAGEGPERSNLEKQISINQLTGYVKLLGFTKNVRNIMPLFDIYASPSLMEGFGMSIVEAMSCGLPVVSTGVGGVTDFLRHMENSYLVRPRDPCDLAAGISYFLENENEAGLISACACSDIKRYETDNLIKYLEMVYQSEPFEF